MATIRPTTFANALAAAVSAMSLALIWSDTTVTEESLLAARHWDLNADELRWIMVNGFKSSFLPFRQKKMLMRRVIGEFDALVEKHGGRKPVKLKEKIGPAKSPPAAK